ncbi:MAG: hypothetical protein ABJN42_13605, partial [Roseibium sp.]|uniref:hypothetical protein n=1 Tax=Roseibium sp. TaxID=1936156 RepID=UPI003297B137
QMPQNIREMYPDSRDPNRARLSGLLIAQHRLENGEELHPVIRRNMQTMTMAKLKKIGVK